MKTKVEFRANNDGDIEEIITTIYTPDEYLAKAGEVYRFAQEMKAAPKVSSQLDYFGNNALLGKTRGTE